MKVSITFSELDAEKAAKLIDTAKEFAPTTTVATEPAPAKTKAAKAKSAKVEEPEATGDDDIEMDLGDEGGEDEGPTIDDVVKAVKEYADKNDRKAAIAILKKFKVKSVHEIKPEDFSKVLKALGK